MKIKFNLPELTIISILICVLVGVGLGGTLAYIIWGL